MCEGGKYLGAELIVDNIVVHVEKKGSEKRKSIRGICCRHFLRTDADDSGPSSR